MNGALSTRREKKEGKTRRKYGQSSEEPTLEEQMTRCIPDDVMEAMADLSPEKKYSLYLDIFKPLDIYELLRYYKQNEQSQPEKQSTAENLKIMEKVPISN